MSKKRRRGFSKPRVKSDTLNYTSPRYCQPCGKNLYATRQNAERIAKIRKEESECSLSVYKCRYTANGWHLTSH